MLLLVVVVCEIGFWVLLAAGLIARYALRFRRLSVVVLASVPIVDLVLLVATVLDLRRGGIATPAHGLAAAYIAFSVVFGHRTISAIDSRVAHRFAGGPEPQKSPVRGPAGRREAWRSWSRASAAWGVAVGLLVAAILLVDDGARTRELLHWIIWLTAGLIAWLVAGPLSARVLGRRLV